MTEKLKEENISLEGLDPLLLFGENDAKLKVIKKTFPDVKITSRGTNLKIVGLEEAVDQVKEVFERTIEILTSNRAVSKQVVEELVTGQNPMQGRIPDADNHKVIVYGRDGKPVKAKTHNQKKMVDLSRENDILFAIGPAGTGKTYTAVALAVAALKSKLVKKIILTRPAVEAGESLGFLPGDLKDKIDPYLRPLYDALEDLFPMDRLKFFMENRVIEVAPLAFMRGRTLDNSFIILDEAQNCTSPQLKMFLTRLGPNAKCIITGDLSQVDLPHNQKSGLNKALHILSDVSGIAQVYLNEEDVVRHRLVKEIIKRYNVDDEHEKARYEQRKLEKQLEAEARRSESKPEVERESI
ncbi:MAG: PhoH family protein [Saprospiraceae bacterium]|nr:PhoH family protein [Saprospiraceae bacterium]